MKFYPLYSALADLYDMHGLSLNNDEFETYAYKALEFIGNIYGETVTVPLDIIDYKATLPDDCLYIEQVTSTKEDFQLKDNLYRENYENAILEDYIEARKSGNNNTLYQKGGFLNYETIDESTIKFTIPSGIALLQYRKRLVDENCLPLITHKEITAISSFCIYVYNNKKLNITKDTTIANLLPMYKQDWERKCQNARMPEYMSQNDMDELANVGVSWDRKAYNISYKPVR